MSSLYIVKPESYCSGAGFIVYKLGGALGSATTSTDQLATAGTHLRLEHSV